jgi:hypothetical protein
MSDRDPRLVSAEEILRAIGGPRDVTSNVNMLHPLEVQLPRTYLEHVMRESLATLRAGAADDPATVRAIQQRIDFLGWLAGQPELVEIALYPAADDGLDDLEDLEDLVDDEDEDFQGGRPPF